jgi:hypothetical protein
MTYYRYHLKRYHRVNVRGFRTVIVGVRGLRGFPTFIVVVGAHQVKVLILFHDPSKCVVQFLVGVGPVVHVYETIIEVNVIKVAVFATTTPKLWRPSHRLCWLLLHVSS